jgi:hypothetical protein
MAKRFSYLVSLARRADDADVWLEAQRARGHGLANVRPTSCGRTYMANAQPLDRCPISGGGYGVRQAARVLAFGLSRSRLAYSNTGRTTSAGGQEGHVI